MYIEQSVLDDIRAQMESLRSTVNSMHVSMRSSFNNMRSTINSMQVTLGEMRDVFAEQREIITTWKAEIAAESTSIAQVEPSIVAAGSSSCYGTNIHTRKMFDEMPDRNVSGFLLSKLKDSEFIDLNTMLVVRCYKNVDVLLVADHRLLLYDKLYFRVTHQFRSLLAFKGGTNSTISKVLRLPNEEKHFISETVGMGYDDSGYDHSGGSIVLKVLGYFSMVFLLCVHHKDYMTSDTCSSIGCFFSCATLNSKASLLSKSRSNGLSFPRWQSSLLVEFRAFGRWYAIFSWEPGPIHSVKKLATVHHLTGHANIIRGVAEKEDSKIMFSQSVVHKEGEFEHFWIVHTSPLPCISDVLPITCTLSKIAKALSGPKLFSYSNVLASGDCIAKGVLMMLSNNILEVAVEVDATEAYQTCHEVGDYVLQQGPLVQGFFFTQCLGSSGWPPTARELFNVMFARVEHPTNTERNVTELREDLVSKGLHTDETEFLDFEQPHGSNVLHVSDDTTDDTTEPWVEGVNGSNFMIVNSYEQLCFTHDSQMVGEKVGSISKFSQPFSSNALCSTASSNLHNQEFISFPLGVSISSLYTFDISNMHLIYERKRSPIAEHKEFFNFKFKDDYLSIQGDLVMAICIEGLGNTTHGITKQGATALEGTPIDTTHMKFNQVSCLQDTRPVYKYALLPLLKGSGLLPLIVMLSPQHLSVWKGMVVAYIPYVYNCKSILVAATELVHVISLLKSKNIQTVSTCSCHSRLILTLHNCSQVHQLPSTMYGRSWAVFRGVVVAIVLRFYSFKSYDSVVEEQYIFSKVLLKVLYIAQIVITKVQSSIFIYRGVQGSVERHRGSILTSLLDYNLGDIVKIITDCVCMQFWQALVWKLSSPRVASFGAPLNVLGSVYWHFTPMFRNLPLIYKNLSLMEPNNSVPQKLLFALRYIFYSNQGLLGFAIIQVAIPSVADQKDVQDLLLLGATNVLNDKFKSRVRHLLMSEGILISDDSSESWLDIVTSLAWEAALLIAPDTTGVEGMLGHSSDGLSSFGSMEQEKDRLKSITEIETCHPNVVLVEKTVSRDVQESFRAKGITLVADMKPHRLQRIARYTDSNIFSSDGSYLSQKLTQGESLYFEKFVEEHGIPKGGKKATTTLMFLEGSPRLLGCSLKQAMGGTETVKATVLTVHKSPPTTTVAEDHQPLKMSQHTMLASLSDSGTSLQPVCSRSIKGGYHSTQATSIMQALLHHQDTHLEDNMFMMFTVNGSKQTLTDAVSMPSSSDSSQAIPLSSDSQSKSNLQKCNYLPTVALPQPSVTSMPCCTNVSDDVHAVQTTSAQVLVASNQQSRPLFALQQPPHELHGAGIIDDFVLPTSQATSTTSVCHKPP